jgi:adenylate cyclase
MTSLKVLVGAEVDKMIVFGSVTAVLALALIRARRLLVRAVAEEAAAKELSRFFAPEIAETIKSADRPIQPGEGVLREAAAMFVDLRGFTNLATSLDPHALVKLLGEYQHRVVHAVRAHGGSVTAYLGDGVMITFGAAGRSTPYAAQALAAAEEIIATMEIWRRERETAGLPAPGVGIGVCSGTVIYGAIGEEGRLEYTVLGDPVNRAAKIQNHTKQIGVRALTHAATFELAQRQGYRPLSEPRAVDNCSVIGIAEAIDLVALG